MNARSHKTTRAVAIAAAILFGSCSAEQGGRDASSQTTTNLEAPATSTSTALGRAVLESEYAAAIAGACDALLLHRWGKSTTAPMLVLSRGGQMSAPKRRSRRPLPSVLRPDGRPASLANAASRHLTRSLINRDQIRSRINALQYSPRWFSSISAQGAAASELGGRDRARIQLRVQGREWDIQCD